MGWQDAPVVGESWRDAPLVDEKKKQPERSTLDELKRQAGLTLRYGVEGLAGIPGMFISPFQQVAGAKTMTQRTSELLDWAGAPKPEGDTEDFVGAVSRATAGGAGFAKLAGVLGDLAKGGLTELPRVVGTSKYAPSMGIPQLPRVASAEAYAPTQSAPNILAQQPLLQTVQAGTGAGASELTKQAGGGETAQLLAGALTPMAATGAVNAIGMAGRGARELVRPVTAKGAEQIAADVIGSTVQDKGTALRNLETWLAAKKGEATGGPKVGVPGSLPTSGAVAGDYGLIGAEQLAARGPANPLFAQRFAANNQANLDELAKLRATEEVIAQYAARRDATTAALREKVFANAKGPVDFAPVGEQILQAANTAAGGREESRKALSWLADRVGRNAQEGRTDVQNAYALHQDIGDLVAGKIKDSNGAALRLAGGLANEVKKTLAQQIELASPGFKKYLETYSRMSKPIDRLQVIADKLGGVNLDRVTNAGPVVGPEGPTFALSQAKMRNAVAGIEGALPDGPNGLDLAPYQRDVLGRVSGDLNASALAARGGKMPGSDTYQNMATANFLRGVLGDNLAAAGAPKVVTAPLNLAMRPLESRINDLVTQAFLDPKLMAELLKKARTSRPSPSLLGLTQEAERGMLGGLLGGAIGQ